MGRCANCHRHVGIFFNKWRKLGGAKYCLKCVPDVMEARRQDTVRAIRAGGPLTALFAVPVVSRDIDYPSNHRRYAGLLLFTDKGIIFAQAAEYRKSDSAGAVFGAVGGLIDWYVEKKHRKGAFQAAWGQLTASAEDAMSMLDAATQVFFFPLQEIRKLSGGSANCRLKAGKRSILFQWEGGKKAIGPYRELFNEYKQAVKTGRGVPSKDSTFDLTPHKQ